MRLPHWFFVLLVALLLPLRAHAAPTQDVTSCTYPVGTMDFGTLTSPVPQTDNTPNPTLNCSGGSANSAQSLCVSISAGTGGSSGTTRLMTSGANTLQYNIFFDSGHATVWGDNGTIGNAQQVNMLLNSAGSGSISLPLYGRIPAQTVSTGTYTSTLTVSVKPKPGGSPCSSNSGTTIFNTTFGTKAIISASCSISASNVDFGTAGSLASALIASGSLSVTCTNAAPYTIAMNAGSTTGNTIAARKMSLNGAGAGVLSYQLYRDSNTPPTTLWGDGTTGAVYTGSGTGSAQTIPVYGQVPSQATPAPGTYQDTVTATITF
jgi:spore coat protein U-like protein